MSSSLPERACLEQYRRQAKDLVRGATREDSAALAFLRDHHPEVESPPKLTDAQHAVARSLGFASWPKLKAGILEAETPGFLDAVGQGDLEAVGRYLGCAPELAKVNDPERGTALIVAAEANHAALAEVLVKAGSDLEAKYQHSGHTALSWAVTVSSFDFARELVRLGDEPDLFAAAGIGDLPRVQKFWEGGRLRPSPSRTGSSRFAANGERLPRPPESDADQVSDALYMASRHGRADVVRWLLDHGADPNFRGYLGATNLHWAEFANSPETAQLLRDAGLSDETVEPSYGTVPRAFGVTVTAAWGLVQLLYRILDRDPDRIGALSRSGTPLHAAAREGQAQSIAVLLHFGADREARNAEGKSAAEVGEENGHPEVAALLRA